MADDSRQAKRRPQRRSAPPVGELARRAAEQLGELLGRAPEGVVSIDRHEDDGWRIGVDVLEVHRVPETADVLATYEVDLDGDGQLTGYRRARRYVRGQVEG
jgi:hypothetical protein